MKNKLYKVNVVELIFYSALYIAFSFLAGMIFFDNYIMALFVIPFVVYLIFKYIKNSKKKHNKVMLERFRLFISYLNAGMQGASKPVEKAFFEAVDEMIFVYSEKDIFLKHMITIRKTLDNNNARKLELEFYDFAVKTKIPDIIDFANVLISCKNTNTSAISDVIRLTDELIGEKINAQMDFQVMIQENKMVFNIMSLMPMFFIEFFNFCMTDYLSPLYKGAGRVVMIIGLVLNAFCYIMGNKFIERYDKK